MQALLTPTPPHRNRTVNPNPTAESTRRRLEGKNRRAHEKLMAARKKESDFKASIKKQHEDHAAHMRQRKKQEDFENLLKKTERDLKLENKKKHAIHTAQAEKYRVQLMAEEQDEIRRRLNNLDDSKRRMGAGRQLFLQQVKRNRDDLAEELHHIKVMNSFQKLDMFDESTAASAPGSTHSNLPPISPTGKSPRGGGMGGKQRSSSVTQHNNNNRSPSLPKVNSPQTHQTKAKPARAQSTPPVVDELMLRVERLEQQLSASQQLAGALEQHQQPQLGGVPVGHVSQGLSRGVTPPSVDEYTTFAE